MKTIKFTLAIILLFSINKVFAQYTDDDGDMRTLFGSSNSIGGYGGLSVGYADFKNFPSSMVGFRGMLVVGHNVAIGIGGNGFFSDFRYNSVYNKDAYIAGGYGGLIVEPILMPKFPVHIALPILMGAGGVTYNINNYYDNSYNFNNDYTVDSKAFFILEPGVEIEFNVLKFFRFSVGAYYRLTNDIYLQDKDSSPITSSDFMRGLSTGVTFKFGKF